MRPVLRLAPSALFVLAVLLGAGCESHHPSAPSITIPLDKTGTAAPTYSTSCLARSDCSSLVAELQGQYGHPSTHAKSFEITRRVAWALREQGAGLLLKPGGENIISFGGHSFAICRICFPDGHIYKVMTDCGDRGQNNPTWADNGFVNKNLYFPPIDPNR